MKPEISVIVPVYNAEKYIIACLDSVRTQSFKNYEVLLIDDGSTDQSFNICKDYITKYELENFRIFQQENKGVCEARNNAISKALGNWLLFLDADDWLEVDALQALYDCAEQYPSDLILGGYQMVDDQTGEIEAFKGYPIKYGEMPKDISQLYSFGFSCMRLFKNDIVSVNNIKFDSRITYSEDNAWNFDYNKFVKSFSCTNEIVYSYRVNRTGSQTTGLVTPRMKYYIWEHMEGFFAGFDQAQIKEALKTNDHLLGVVWGILSTAIINDILDKNYSNAKEKSRSVLGVAVQKYYQPHSVKECLFVFLLKHSFMALCLFARVYYGNFEVLRRSKILRIISKTK